MELKPLHREIIRFVVTVAAAAAIGSYFTYQKVMETPVPAQFAVVDMAEVARTLQKSIDPDKPSGQIAIREMGDAMRNNFKELTAAGVVVLDSSMVIASPKEAQIDVDAFVRNKAKESRDEGSTDKQ